MTQYFYGVSYKSRTNPLNRTDLRQYRLAKIHPWTLRKNLREIKVYA